MKKYWNFELNKKQFELLKEGLLKYFPFSVMEVDYNSERRELSIELFEHPHTNLTTEIPCYLNGFFKAIE